jgi:ubiquinone/menaquinone biosynthesis C-methylase UbiE
MSTSSAVISQRVQRYILDGSDEDLRRLLRIAQISEDAARTAFDRVGARDGWTAIDCGRGPIGEQAVLAEIVGPNGRVVGVDFSEPSMPGSTT